MKGHALLIRSRRHLLQFPEAGQDRYAFRTFSQGAQWMLQRLAELRGKPASTNLDDEAFTLAGLFKYAFSTACFVLSLACLLPLNGWLSPLAVLVFYLAEVQLMFLFPLMLDRQAHPVASSLRLTAKIGTWQAVCVVIPIAAYMLTGLFSFRQPFRNWHIGCLAILIWYTDETGNRC